MSDFQKDSLTLEETNRLRISLGLKPLTDDSDSKKTGEAEPVKSQDDIAAENYRQRQADELKQREDQDLKDRLAKAQARRDARKQLQGPTLGDIEAEPSGSTSDSKSTQKWLKQAAKRAKQHAAQRAKELEEQEAAAQASYGEQDLSGLKVGHDLDDFDLGDEGRILTLRDSRILDGEEDELMDAELEQKELDRRNEERKKGPKKYTGLDDEMDEAFAGQKKGVLSKYDADIPGGVPRDSDGGFRLGGDPQASSERSEIKKKELEEEARKRNRTLLSLDYASELSLNVRLRKLEVSDQLHLNDSQTPSLHTENQEVSDYLTADEVGFKKSKVSKRRNKLHRQAQLNTESSVTLPCLTVDSFSSPPPFLCDHHVNAHSFSQTKKKKRATSSRVKLDLDDEAPQGGAAADGDAAMSEEPIIHARRQAEERDNLVDDDELAASLAKARRAKAKSKVNKLTPEQIAQNLAAQREAEEAEERRQAAESTAGQGLTFDGTSEFIRSIAHRNDNEAEEEASRRQRRAISQQQEVHIKAEPEDEMDLLAANDGDEGEDDDEEMANGYPASPPRFETTPSRSPEAERGIGTSSEPVVANGLAATLNMLRSQGMIEGRSAEQLKREASQREYDRWMNQHKAEEAFKKEEARISKLQGAAKDQATREHENKRREYEEAKQASDRYRDYKPDVDIKYHDEHGRQLNPHEAWKELSHRFHGKLPGKAKQEKAKKKIEEERKRERMVAGESTDMSKAFRERQAREGQAHMVLSVGSRGNAPQAFADSVGPNLMPSASRPSAKGKGKASTSAATAAGPSGSRMMSPEGSMSPYPSTLRDEGTASVVSDVSSFQPAATTLTTASSSTGPRMRPAFQPIEASSSPAPQDQGTPQPGDKGGLPKMGGFKLAFGNGKRKAEEQGGR